MERPRSSSIKHPAADKSAQEALFHRLALTPDPQERKNLVHQVTEEYLDLADALARQYARRGIDVEDLTQVARMGLVLAVERFRLERGCPFEAFAVPTIKGELRRYFRDQGWLVRPPRRIQELRASVRQTRSELEQAHGREPTVAEVADRLEVDRSEIVECLAADACFTGLSLDAPTSDERPAFAERLAQDASDIDEVADRLALRRELKTLCERDRRTLEWRFVDGLTQSEIGERLGVSQMQVSRILARILAGLRSAIVDDPARAA